MCLSHGAPADSIKKKVFALGNSMAIKNRGKTASVAHRSQVKTNFAKSIATRPKPPSHHLFTPRTVTDDVIDRIRWKNPNRCHTQDCHEHPRVEGCSTVGNDGQNRDLANQALLRLFISDYGMRNLTAASGLNHERIVRCLLHAAHRVVPRLASACLQKNHACVGGSVSDLTILTPPKYL